MYVEPYLFDVVTKDSRTPGSQSYLLYGVAPRFTAGLLPSFSLVKDARAERHLRMGDITLDIQYRLTAPNPDKTFPTVAIVLQEVLPTATYDHLKTADAGTGSGTFSTLVGLYAQQYFWLPNGRILRGRVNLTHKVVGTAHIEDISIYGTTQGFHGTARPGDSTTVDLAAEYSVTKQYVLALELLHQWNGRTVVEAHAGSTTVENPILPGSRITAVVPAVEYNWSSNEGIIAGTRFILKGRNSDSSITPVIAYSRFF